MDKRKVHRLLVQTAHHDKDERFMATSDIITELSNVEGSGMIVEPTIQKAIRNAILKQLKDKSIDVQAVAVKCLSILVKTFASDQVVDIVKSLGVLVVDTNQSNESRDIYGIGLKTIITSLRSKDGQLIADNLSNILIEGLIKTSTNDRILFLEILKDLVQRFGSVISDECCWKIVQILLTLLQINDESLRKRASVTMGTIVKYINDSQFDLVIKDLFGKLEKNVNQQSMFIYSYVQTIGIIAQNAGKKIAPYLNIIIPKLQTFCNNDSSYKQQEGNTSINNDNNNNEEIQSVQIDLWETCIQAYESIIRQCPIEVQPFLQLIISICLEKLSYDPNYSYDIDMDDMEEIDNGDWGDDDDDEFFEEDEHQDDDDSWKVRRAAAITIDTFITTRHIIDIDTCKLLYQILIQRLKERDLSVKSEIILCLRDLIKRENNAHQNDNNKQILMNNLNQIIDSCELLLSDSSTNNNSNSNNTNDNNDNNNNTAIVSSLNIQKLVFELIQQLLIVCNKALGTYLSRLIPYFIEFASKSKDLVFCTAALNLLELILKTQEFSILLPFLDSIANVIVLSLNESYSQLKISALNSICAIIKLRASISNDEMNDKWNNVLNILFPALYETFLSQVVEQKVKEVSIDTLSLLISQQGEQFEKYIPNILPIFIERLANETTRMSIIRAITRIANSGSNHFLLPILNDLIIMLTNFCKQQSSTLKQQVYISLTSLININIDKIPNNTIQQLLVESASQINDTDLMLSHLILDLASNILENRPETIETIANSYIKPIIIFVQSPLVQGMALQSLLNLLIIIVKSNSSILSSEKLLRIFKQCANANTHKQCLTAISQCIAVILINSSADVCINSINEFTNCVADTNSDLIQCQLSLLVLGDIGRSRDMSEHSNIENVLYSALLSTNHEVRITAATAFGHICIGNINKYIPILLNLIHDHPNDLFYLLSSIRASLCCINNHHCIQSFQLYVDQLLKMLVNSSSNSNDDIRILVAECFGQLVRIQPQIVLKTLNELSTSDNALIRGVSISALRHIKFDEIDATLFSIDTTLFESYLPKFLLLLNDSDLNVRCLSLITTNALIYNKPNLISTNLLDDLILPVVVESTHIIPELIHNVNYGCFQQKEDDGIPLRKAAFQCLYTMLIKIPTRLHLPSFLHNISLGFKDEVDLQILSYNMLHRLATQFPQVVLNEANSIPSWTKSQITAQLRAVKHKDSERIKDSLRAAVRALYAVNCIPNIEVCSGFQKFYARVLKTSLLAAMLKELTQN